MPLETPTLLDDEVSSQVYRAANKRIESDEATHDFVAWSQEMDRYARDGVSLARSERSLRTEVFDLNHEETIDPTVWTNPRGNEVPSEVIEQPEARTPMTRVQQIEVSLFPLTDRQLLAYAVANTNAVWALKHLG